MGTKGIASLFGSAAIRNRKPSGPVDPYAGERNRLESIKPVGPFFCGAVILLFGCGFCDIDAQPLPSNDSSITADSEPGSANIWQNGVGEGFRASTHSIGLSLGATYGLTAFGSLEQHDLALVSFSYGHMLGHTLGQDHWYRGNPELRFEIFTGAQFSPSSDWFVGLTPHLRYNFATGTRWIPFVDIGAGATATGIGAPDLSNTFEFNLQGGGGLHWFMKDNLALTLEARYVHWSCAGLSEPNLGLNGITGMLGITLFF